MYGLSWSPRFAPALQLIVPVATALLVPCFVHLVECVTNVRFRNLAERWDELKGWQRGLLGTGLVLMAGLVILSLAFGVGMHLAQTPVHATERTDGVFGGAHDGLVGGVEGGVQKNRNARSTAELDEQPVE
jgi:hypothetical protein